MPDACAPCRRLCCSPFDGLLAMRDVPIQMSDSRRHAASEGEGTIISVERISDLPSSPARRAIPAPPPRPVWGGLASPPPPTRDFRGPLLFVAALVGVALTSVGLLIYAVSQERGDRLDPYGIEGQTTTVAGGGAELAETASVWVDGTPYGATLWVNTDSMGTLPMTVENLPEGEHLLTVEANGMTLDTLISVGAGEAAAVFLRLEAVPEVAETVVEVETPATEAPPPAPVPQAVAPPPPTTGLLRVVSRPAGATVQLDGVPVGTTPLALPAVVAGRHTVTAALDGHQPRNTSVEVVAGRDQMVTLSLEANAEPGMLQVLVRPWGSIYIDGSLRKSNTDVLFRTELPAGTHEIRVVHPTFGTRTRQVTVGSGQAVMEVFDLTTGATDGGS